MTTVKSKAKSSGDAKSAKRLFRPVATSATHSQVELNAITIAASNPNITDLAQAAAMHLGQLVSAAAYPAMLQAAALAAFYDETPVEEKLQQEIRRIKGELELTSAEHAAANDILRSASNRFAKLNTAVGKARTVLEVQVIEATSAIGRAVADRIEKVKRLREAGLSDAEIVGLAPEPVDLTASKNAEISDLKARIDRLTAFLRDPLQDVSVLAGLGLDAEIQAARI